MKNLVIGVVGGGVVGRATARTYLEHVEEVRVWDVVKERSTHAYLDGLALADVVFVCLPTPQIKDSLKLDLDCVEQFFSQVPRPLLGANFVLRSTVPIGTTRYLVEKYRLPNLVYSPEFLTSRCAVTDAQIPSRNIIGFPVASEWVETSWAKVVDLYQRRFPGVPNYLMSSDESEAVKLFQNSFFATKVAFWNECRTLADKLGLDWERVMEGILSDGRISPSHTQVPGPDGKRGFGGTCLPKDLSCLVSQLLESVLPATVTSAAALRNKTYDRRESHG